MSARVCRDCGVKVSWGATRCFSCVTLVKQQDHAIDGRGSAILLKAMNAAFVAFAERHQANPQFQRFGIERSLTPLQAAQRLLMNGVGARGLNDNRQIKGVA